MSLKTQLVGNIGYETINKLLVNASPQSVHAARSGAIDVEMVNGKFSQ